MNMKDTLFPLNPNSKISQLQKDCPPFYVGVRYHWARCKVTADGADSTEKQEADKSPSKRKMQAPANGLF